MKIRNGFVSNSSSSSFLVISSDKGCIIEDEYDHLSNSDYDTRTFNIDELIELLQKHKNDGATKITINYGASYDG
jgi:hypothetical protein